MVQEKTEKKKRSGSSEAKVPEDKKDRKESEDLTVIEGSEDKVKAEENIVSEDNVKSEEDSNEDNSIDNSIDIEDEKIIKKTGDAEIEVVSADALSEDDLPVKKSVKADNRSTSAWAPKTEIGRKVKSGEINDIDIVLDKGLKILEPEIVEALLPEMESDLLLIGQSKGKFGGGQRRVFRQTQKKTQEGNKPKFATFAVVGDSNGHVGLGYGKAKETVPAREKALCKAKLNIMKIRRGCGSWQCSCGTPHTIPFKVIGKCGSVTVTLMPAPKGTGLCVESEVAKILKLAGVKDIWSKTRGKARTKINHIFATISALQKLSSTKIMSSHKELLSIAEGSIKAAQTEKEVEA
ncbi:30S ribosomal protein S5 [Candidatus Woesearchaeota archaeon]|nr:30S ribosomal protein S5 [Candidatus Woesearchaeota archaeon]